jgi:thiol-disulfide isomerase/thioredoxin
MLSKIISSFDDFYNYLETYNNIIINVGASWCKPCNSLKPMIDKYISVIDTDCIYLKLDYSIHESDHRFDEYFTINKIPLFLFIKNKKIINSFVSSDFIYVSSNMYNFITNKLNNNDDNNFKINNDF